MIHVATSEQFKELTAQEGLTVAVFKADWCSDCKYMDPFMPDVEEQYKDSLTLIQVDVEQLAGISQELNILGIPSFVAFADGRELVRYVNKLRKTREEIEDFLNKAVLVHESLKRQS